MKKGKLALLISGIVISALALAIAVPFTVLAVRTNSLNADYSYLKTEDEYKDKVEVAGLELVTQHVSCGYATIEMLSSFYGNKVTEDELDARNGTISTSSSKGFLNEVNYSIPSKSFVMSSYLKNDDFLKEIYGSLKNNEPAAIEWAAKYEDEWTLHFSIVSALDLVNDNVTVYNPYGFIENIGLDEFLDRTSFNAYKGMPIFLSFGFAFGAFDKNTIFHVK